MDKVTRQNAARRYQFYPFERRPREEATVGALRARVHDVDTAPREYGGLDHSHGLEYNASRFFHQQD